MLFEATCEERWFTQAGALADTLIARFADPERRRLLLDRRRRRSADRAAQGPGGHADPRRQLERRDGPAAPVAAHRRAEYERHAVSVLRLLAEIAPRHPTAFGHLLQALHWHFAPARPIACAVPKTGV